MLYLGSDGIGYPLNKRERTKKQIYRITSTLLLASHIPVSVAKRPTIKCAQVPACASQAATSWLLAWPFPWIVHPRTTQSLMSFCSLMNYWTIPKHVSYNMADVVMDFRFRCNNIWTDLIEEILYVCNQDFEIILVSRCMVSRVLLNWRSALWHTMYISTFCITGNQRWAPKDIIFQGIPWCRLMNDYCLKEPTFGQIAVKFRALIGSNVFDSYVTLTLDTFAFFPFCLFISLGVKMSIATCVW